MPKDQELLLIQKAKQEPTAFSKLYRAYIHRVYGYLASRVQTQSEAEDLTSDVWEKVLRMLPGFEPTHEASFAAWLFRIAKNTLIDHYRCQTKRSQVSLDSISDLPNLSDSPEENAAKNNNADQIIKLIDQLPDQQAHIISLRFFSELKNKEIAEILQIEEKSVSSALCRGLRNLFRLWQSSN